MQNLRRMALALAVPTVAVAAIAFTAHSALSAPTAVPAAAATDNPNQQQQKQNSPGGGIQPNTRFTQFTNFTNFTKATGNTSGAPTTSAKPTTMAPTTTSAPPTTSTSGSATPSRAPSGTGGAGAGAALTNCVGKHVQAPLTVKVATVKNNQTLVDGDGCTLYVFTQDTAGASACDASCEASWPPAPGPATAGEGLQQANFGTFSRQNGFTQTAYFGKQLYYFSGDRAPGDANGQAQSQSWYIVDPSGNPITR